MFANIVTTLARQRYKKKKHCPVEDGGTVAHVACCLSPQSRKPCLQMVTQTITTIVLGCGGAKHQVAPHHFMPGDSLSLAETLLPALKTKSKTFSFFD